MALSPSYFLKFDTPNECMADPDNRNNSSFCLHLFEPMTPANYYEPRDSPMLSMKGSDV